MNNIPFPYLPQIPYQNEQPPILDQIKKLQLEIEHLKERVNQLENSKKNSFLQKDDGFYMM